MPAEHEPSPPPSTDGSAPDEPPRPAGGKADDRVAERAAPGSGSGASPVVDWSQRHATAAWAARSGADSATEPDPAPIVSWSRRHATAARAARAGRNDPAPVRGDTASGAETVPGASAPATPGRARHMGAATRFVLNPLAALVRLLGWLLGLLMVLYLLFASLGANPANPWARFVESWAPRLDLGLGHLSVLPDPRIELWVSYGIAAVLWVLIGVIVGRVIGRIGARQRTASHTGGGDLP